MGLVFAFVGIAPTTAAADPPEENAAQGCESALQGEPDPQLVLSTDPTGGTTVAPGDDIEATLTWGTAEGDDVWAGIDKVLLCVTVDDVLDEESIHEQKPGVDDGTESTSFTVPEGASEVCVHGRVSGNPGPDNDTDSTHKTGQTCFPVGEPECEPGQTGTYPDCEDPECEAGQLGTYPDCEDPCALDETIPADDPACGECEPGQTGTYPDCEDPVDVCADIEGDQAEGTDCEADVLPTVVTPDDPAAPAAEVKGAVTLPVTGVSTLPLAGLGLGLIALGRALVARSRRASA